MRRSVARTCMGAVVALALLAGVVPAQGQVAGYRLLVSSFSDRSGPIALAGATVAGDAFIFVDPASSLKRVKFYVDDPQRNGEPFFVERTAPWDLAGSTPEGSAEVFDTSVLNDGSHTITAELIKTNSSSEVISSQFNVSNSGPALTAQPSSLALAVAPGSSTSAIVDIGTTGGGNSNFTTSSSASWLSVSPTSGSTPRSLTVSANAASLGEGSYTGMIELDSSTHRSATVTVNLSVGNEIVADQIHLAWVEDPATTMTVVWRTNGAVSSSKVSFRRKGTTAWSEIVGGIRPSGTEGSLREVTLRSLTPQTDYEYRVFGAGNQWSPVYETRTAPSASGDFEAIYVADTGIVGRTDGLTTGTQQVIDEIAGLNPDVVLLGGDYAYYDSDNRFSTLDDAIDAWFNQMQPISASTPMMPTYGNHEVLLGEGFGPWAARFPTPPGFDGRRHYSFDMGDVHFISIMAVAETSGLSAQTLNWIEQDALAAQQAGARWVVPFFHVSPFSDGKNHKSNTTLRGQLGPLFEELGIELAISSHDQSYERTFPLVDVPGDNTPTSSSLSCYDDSDGVSWVKVSPGGKLSNKNGDFSAFKTVPPPDYTAVRNNTHHHFLRLIVDDAGSLEVEIHALAGNGSASFVQDRFRITQSSCPGQLEVAPTSASLTASAGGSATTSTVALSSGQGAQVPFTINENAPWLQVLPLTGTTPRSLSLTANPSGLAPGTYSTSVTATSPSAGSVILPVTFTVTGGQGGSDFDLLLSSSPNRLAPTPLNGATASGLIYVFSVPELGVNRVRFYLDDPNRNGTPIYIEKNAPWDLQGTNADGTAIPFDTGDLSNGAHTITAEIRQITGATEVVTATVNISNGGTQ